MICIISQQRDDAVKYARSQFLSKSEWFWANDVQHIRGREAFHVLVVGEFEDKHFFDRLYAEAQSCGSRGRK